MKPHAFFNDYDYVSFEQDNEHKDMFNVLFSKNYDRNKITDEDEIMKNYKEMQLDDHHFCDLFFRKIIWMVEVEWINYYWLAYFDE